jgi:RNA polymerase sigma-70 factor, ECF subfamily
VSSSSDVPRIEAAALTTQPSHDLGRPDPTPRAGRGTPRSDDELDQALQLARLGDEGGFTTLWRALHPPLLRYLTVRGNPAPEDIAGETWLQVVRDLDGFAGGAPEFRAWLFTVARHRAIDAGRAVAARPSIPMADPAANGW